MQIRLCIPQNLTTLHCLQDVPERVLRGFAADGTFVDQSDTSEEEDSGPKKVNSESDESESVAAQTAKTDRQPGGEKK